MRAISIWIVEQLGLATIAPPRAGMRWPLTSGTTRGTSSSIRNALELSTTRQPAAAPTGPHSRAMDEPAEKSATAAPSKTLAEGACRVSG